MLLRRESDPTEGEDGMDLLRANTFPSPPCFVLPWAAGDSSGGHGDLLLQEAFPWVLELQRGMLGHCLLPSVWEHWAGPAPPGWAENAGMSRTHSQPQWESTTDPDPRFSIPLPLAHPLRSKQLLQHRAKHRAKASTPNSSFPGGHPKAPG